MNMKINKACDLSSISVLPPHSRRSSGVLPGPQSSHSQQFHLRSQAASQQSFSQSSQHGMHSQMSQSSLDEAITNDQRLGSQERENSAKKNSCLVPLSYAREETQIPLSRSSASLMHKWSSNAASDHRCRISEELELKIGMIETSVNRFGMILDSVQSDVMQVNKGTKEMSLELYSMRQKLTDHESLLQVMSKVQEDAKDSLAGGLKRVNDQLGNTSNQDKLQETLLPLSALPGRMEAYIQTLKHDLCNAFTSEMKEMSKILKNVNQNKVQVCAHPPKDISHGAASQKVQQSVNMNEACQKEHTQASFVQRIEMGSWNSVKLERSAFTNRSSITEHKQRRFSPAQKENDWRVTIESDEETGACFPSLLEEKKTGMGNYLIEEADEETRRILRKARRRKRKHSNTIVID